MQTVDLMTVNGTQMFTVQSVDPRYNRVHGNNLLKEQGRYIFPAYPPYGSIVLQDLKKVDAEIQLSATVQQHADYLAKLPELLDGRVLPQGFTFHTKPFDHQIEALSYLYHHPRFALFYEPGTGKTKIAIDLLRILKTEGQRALVLGPRVVVRNWAAEAKKHAGSDLKIGVLVGDTTRKRKVISRYKEYDVIVCSYGTARTLGLPRLNKKTLQLILDAKAAGREIAVSGVKDLANGVRQLADPERQAAHVLAWALGMSAAAVIRHAQEESKQNPQWIEDIDYQVIIADESHGIKDMSSQQTKTVLALSKKAGRRYLMTGTPSLGKPEDLYPQMKFLSPSIFPEDWLHFQDMFLVKGDSLRNKHMVLGYKNLNILNSRVQRISIQKRKDECLDLPERMIIDVPFELTDDQKKLYNTLVNNMGADLTAFFDERTDGNLDIQNAAILLNKLSQISSGFVMDSGKDTELCNGCPHLARCVEKSIQPYTSACAVASKLPLRKISFFKENPKLDIIEDLLEDILEEETNKVIIWGVHTAELDAIEQRLDQMKITCVRVDGKSGGNTQKLVDRFNEDPTVRVYLSQISTGVGITLNAATYMIYSSLDWSLGNYLQSIDRNYRAGQTKKVTVYRLLGENTVDQYKAVALDQKRDISATLTNKLACTTCSKRFDCLKNKIELFEQGCIYKRNAKRTVAKAGVV
jgi:SNF2 family DNA or RNA helicase